MPSDSHLQDFIDPVILAEATACDVRYQLKYVVTKATNIDDVLLFCRLSGPIRLNVNADHLCLWIALLKHIPLLHCFCGVVSVVRSAI